MVGRRTVGDDEHRTISSESPSSDGHGYDSNRTEPLSHEIWAHIMAIGHGPTNEMREEEEWRRRRRKTWSRRANNRLRNYELNSVLLLPLLQKKKKKQKKKERKKERKKTDGSRAALASPRSLQIWTPPSLPLLSFLVWSETKTKKLQLLTDRSMEELPPAAQQPSSPLVRLLSFFLSPSLCVCIPVSIHTSFLLSLSLSPASFSNVYGFREKLWGAICRKETFFDIWKTKYFW